MFARKPYFLSTFILFAYVLSLTSCMVGPNFHSPLPPPVDSYTSHSLPSKTVSTPAAGKGGKSQWYRVGRDIPAEWWYLFHSPEINTLIRIALHHNQNLAAALAGLRQAQQLLYVQIGNNLFPAIDAGFSAQRQRFAGDTLGLPGLSSIFNVFNASITVSYMLDVFGGARRQIETAAAQVDYQQFLLLGAYLTMTTNIVTTAIMTASLEAQIVATRQLIAAQEQQLYLIQQQLRLGSVASTNVLNQQYLVEQTRATLPPLQKSLAQAKHALAVLIGAFPNEPLPNIRLDNLVLPKEIPISFPSELVRQRPDVRAAEAQLHTAMAQIGVATANLFPQFNITANYGFSGGALGGLFSSGNKVWSIAGGITQPIFRGGALISQRRAALAAYDQALAQYRQTVLQAFQNVADSLRAIETDARGLRAQKAAEIAALQTLNLTRRQYILGSVNYLNLLTAQQQYQQAIINRIQAQALRYSDTAALFQALGGGWWNRPNSPCDPDPINPNNASKKTIGCAREPHPYLRSPGPNLAKCRAGQTCCPNQKIPGGRCNILGASVTIVPELAVGVLPKSVAPKAKIKTKITTKTLPRHMPHHPQSHMTHRIKKHHSSDH